MAVDNNSIILAFVFLFESVLNHTFFTVIIYILVVAMAVLNVAPIRTPKFTGRWVYVLTAYVFGLTAIYGWILLSK